MASQSWGRAAGSGTGLCPYPRGGQRGSALPWDTVGASASLRLLPSPSCVGCLSGPAPQMVGKSWGWARETRARIVLPRKCSFWFGQPWCVLWSGSVAGQSQAWALAAQPGLPAGCWGGGPLAYAHS